MKNWLEVVTKYQFPELGQGFECSDLNKLRRAPLLPKLGLGLVVAACPVVLWESNVDLRTSSRPSAELST